MASDSADFEALLDHLLGELRLELSRKYRWDMNKRLQAENTEGVTQLFDFEAPASALQDVRIETMHSMIAPPENSTSLSSTPSLRTSRRSRSIQFVDADSVDGLPGAFQPGRPDGGLRVAWDVMICSVMCLLIVIETTSLAIPEFEEGAFAYWWGLFLLAVFTSDVLVNFNTALVRIVGRKTVVIRDRWQIAKAYFKGWFLIDVLSSFPFDMVLGSGISASGVRLLKLGKVLRTVRLVKGFLKIADLLKRSGEIQDRIHEMVLDLLGYPGHEIDRSQKYVSRMWCLFWFLSFEGHLVACFLLILTRHIPSLSWRTRGEDIHELDPYSRYIAAFRDVVYVLATGNGDLGVGDIVLTVLAVWFYLQLGLVISVFVGIAGDKGLDDEDFAMKCSRLRRYLRHHKVIKQVRDEVDSHLSKVGKYVGMNLDCFLEELPTSIRKSVTSGLYYPFYEGMAFFKVESPSDTFEYDICDSLETLFYRPQDTIVSLDATLHGLNYLSEGYAGLTRASRGGSEEEFEWCPGRYIFLESLFAQKASCPSIGEVWAIDACEVWFLARTVFDRLLQETTPSFRRRVELVRSKVHFDDVSYSWGMEVEVEGDKVDFVGLDYLVEDGRVPEHHPRSDDDASKSQLQELMRSKSQTDSDLYPPPVLPPGKRFHYFLSHKKHHRTLGNRTELVAQSLHDALEAKGFIGFFDVDSLVEISRSALEQAVRDSCAMIVVLNDETAESEWCLLEWDCAASNRIPVKCVVDAQHCNKADILRNIQGVNAALLQYQWSEYLDRYRKSVATDLAEWLNTTVSPAMLITKDIDAGGAMGQDVGPKIGHGAVGSPEDSGARQEDGFVCPI